LDPIAGADVSLIETPAAMDLIEGFETTSEMWYCFLIHHLRYAAKRYLSANLSGNNGTHAL